MRNRNRHAPLSLAAKLRQALHGLISLGVNGSSARQQGRAVQGWFDAPHTARKQRNAQDLFNALQFARQRRLGKTRQTSCRCQTAGRRNIGHQRQVIGIDCLPRPGEGHWDRAFLVVRTVRKRRFSAHDSV